MTRTYPALRAIGRAPRGPKRTRSGKGNANHEMSVSRARSVIIVRARRRIGKIPDCTARPEATTGGLLPPFIPRNSDRKRPVQHRLGGRPRGLIEGGRSDRADQQGHANPRQQVWEMVHSITRSARASSDGGIVRPRALAVLRLITSW